MGGGFGVNLYTPIKKPLKMPNVQNMPILLILRFSISLLKNEPITGKTFGERGAGGIYGERPGICHIICCSYIHVIQLLLYSGYSALIHKLSTNIALVALVLCSYSPLNNKIVKKYSSSTSHIYSALIYIFCFNYKKFQKIFFLCKSYLF